VKTLKKIGKIAAPLVLVGIFALTTGVALAANAWGPPDQPTNVPNNLASAILNVTNWILGFIGLIAVLIIIWGGVLYLTAAGNEDQTATAKKTISWGIMGLVIAGLAYAIVYVIYTVWLG